MKLFAVGVVVVAAMQPVSVVNVRTQPLVLSQADASPSKNWNPHDATVKHEKLAGLGYMKGSPHYDKSSEIKISTTMKCIMNLATQYFLIYTVLAILRTMRSISGGPASKALLTVQQSLATVAYVPMLSVLFLGVRMRAVQLSQGQTDKYGLPMPWIQNSMQVCAWCVLVQLLLVLAVPVITGRAPECDADGNLILNRETEKGGREVSGHSVINTMMQTIRFFAMAALYVGFVMVCVGAFMMESPAELKHVWGKDGQPPVSPAVNATMFMAYLYFFCYVCLAVLRQMNNPHHASMVALFNLSCSCVNLAPMMCVLFIGARMRALQIDPVHGAPQSWAQYCFYMCTASLYVQVFLILFCGTVVGAQVEKGDYDGDVRFRNFGNPSMFSFLTALRWIVMFSLYGGVVAVVTSVFTIENKKDPSLTPAISSAMNCVMNLTGQYFFVYTGIYIISTVRQFAGPLVLTKAGKTFDSAKATVMFCPMLSILFIGLRMRALQITNGNGAPQGAAQDCMFLATWAVMLQLLLCLVLPCFSGKEVETDEDGNVKTSGASGAGMFLLEGFRYFCMISMYGGAVGIVHALLTMTPENANGKGSLIPGYEVPKPVSVSETVKGAADAGAPKLF